MQIIWKILVHYFSYYVQFVLHVLQFVLRKEVWNAGTTNVEMYHHTRENTKWARCKKNMGAVINIDAKKKQKKGRTT
jgi:hypothetical protein